MSDTEAFQQLMRLRHLTELTGVLHEAQLFQFKMWSAILFNKQTKVKVVNEHRGSKKVTYMVTGDVDNLPEKAEQVCDWTATILGSGWEIEVRRKGKVIHQKGS